ncbi:MAG TPA: TolC family protein [Armatimonadota bacterium]|nr:TolC family protein [Armatimonadota bacterium]
MIGSPRQARLAPGLILQALFLAFSSHPVSAAQPAPAAPPDSGLTLQQAIDRALARQPLVTAAAQRVRQAEFRLRGSLAFPSTQLDIGHGQILTQPGATGADQDLVITQRLEPFGQRRLRGQQSRRELEAAQASLSQVRAETTFRVRSAYAAARAAAADEALAREALRVAESFHQLAQAQHEAGEVPVTNVLRSEIEVESAQQALLAARTQSRIQQATLRAAMAEPPDGPLALPPIAEVSLHTYDLAEVTALARRQPALRAAEATLAARRTAVSVARSAALPEVTFQAAHDQLQDWPGGHTVWLGFTFPIWDHGAIRAAVGEARAAVAEQEANVAVLRQQAELDVTTAFYGLEQARELVRRTGGEQLQRARRLYELEQLSYSEGLTSYLDLLDAQQVLRTALTAYLRAMAGYETAEAALERALGVPLPAAKSTEPARYMPPVLEMPPAPPPGRGRQP